MGLLCSLAEDCRIVPISAITIVTLLKIIISYSLSSRHFIYARWEFNDRHCHVGVMLSWTLYL